MTELTRNVNCYMEHRGQWIYIVERTFNSGGRTYRNTWSRMPATVDRSRPDIENVDTLIVAREVPKDIRVDAAKHFGRQQERVEQ